MKAERTSTCPTCGARVPVVIDFCPVCALHRACGNDSGLKEALNPVRDSAGTEAGLARVLRSPARPDEGGSAARSATPRIARRFENYELMLNQDGQPIELGRGAIGITYKAFDSDLRFPVTLKVISEKYVGDESAKLRFLREARAAAKVRHPNVGSVFHLGSSGGEYFYVMEFVEGETLESLIKRSGRLEVRLALEIASQVAAGSEAIHEQQLIHRDIKPTNIVVRLKEDGRVTAKIIDLGLAKDVTEAGSQSAISTPGAFAGTPAFASPEQLAGLGLDIRSDLYSLGVTLWEMLAGQAPFGGSATEVIDQHQHGPLPLEQLKGLPQPLVALLEVLLDKDPAQRVQSPGELLKALQAVAAAVDAGRSVTAQDLKASLGEQLTAVRKSGKFQEAFRLRQGLRRAQSSRFGGQVKALFRSFRVRRLVWLVTGLVIAGVVILAVNVFLRLTRPAAESPATSSIRIAVPEKSIAVLPFDSLSENKNDAYFAAGVQEEILSKLASLSQLKVISRTSVMAYHPQSNRDVRSIGTALGVAHLVEGTVQRNANRVRITTELIDARTDETLWTESYERDLTDFFAIQSEIAQKVASKLSAELSPEEQRSIGKRPTTNLEAYDLYLQAKPLVSQINLREGVSNDKENAISYQKATSLLEEAVWKDPTFVLAYCLLARGHDDVYHFQLDKTPERRALADAAIDAAVRLDPANPEVHLAVAYHLYSSYQDYARAKTEVELAQQALPNSSEAFWLAGRIASRLGRGDEALKAFEKAYRCDPRNPDILWYLQGTYEHLQRYRDADEILARISEIDSDNPTGIKYYKAWVAFQRTGDLASWRAALDSLPASVRDHLPLGSFRFWEAIRARDWTAAHQILSKAPDEDLFAGEMVKVPIPRGCGEIWLAALEGKHPTMQTPGFAAVRDQLEQRFIAHPEDVDLLGTLSMIDAFLGRESEAIEEATRAMKLVDAAGADKDFIHRNLAQVYTWTHQPDLAFHELAAILEGSDNSRWIESTKRRPEFDPIRNDPRFDKLGTQHQ